MARKTMRRKSVHKKSHKVARKTAKKGNKWSQFVTQVYRDNHKKNPAFSFRDALKEAKRLKDSGHY
jgi:hypothetical protein